MPLPAERLTKESGRQAIRDAISASIKQCMEEGGRTQAQCAAISYSIAREKTGQKIGKEA